MDDEEIANDYALSFVMDDPEGRSAEPANIAGLLRLVRRKYGSTAAMLKRFGVEDRSLERLRVALVASEG